MRHDFGHRFVEGKMYFTENLNSDDGGGAMIDAAILVCNAFLIASPL